METELKFRLPDEQTMHRLLQVEHLAGMPVGPVTRLDVHDRYFDTPSGRLVRGGYSCRLREASTGDRLVTIKSLGVSGDALHVREEMELWPHPAIAMDQVPLWPEGQARDVLLALMADEYPAELFAFHQQRYQRHMPPSAHDPPQVELSLDKVALGGPDAPVLLGLEAELLPGGTLSLLIRLADEFRTTWHLEPEPLSKFWQALAVMRPDLAAAVRHP